MQESNWDILDSERLQGKGISTTTWNQYTQANWIEGNLDQNSVCNMVIKLNCAKMCSVPFLIKHTFSILLTFTNVVVHFGFANDKMVNVMKERHCLFPRSSLGLYKPILSWFRSKVRRRVLVKTKFGMCMQ